jgi:transcriptional regulator
MKRRDLLASLALAGIPMEAQEHHGPEMSLYIPKPHLVQDRTLLHDFMDEFAFVDLVTTTPELRITHIPSVLNRSQGQYGTIYGHVARHNPQSKALENGERAVIVFHGPHSYISPTWYSKTEVVPTWNFAVVHASGKLQPIADKKPFHDLLAKLIHKFEGAESPYDFSKLPDSYTSSLMEGIIGFSMEIDLLEGKFKLGQERNEKDKQGILKGLEAAKPEQSMRDFTASFYKRQL